MPWDMLIAQKVQTGPCHTLNTFQHPKHHAFQHTSHWSTFQPVGQAADRQYAQVPVQYHSISSNPLAFPQNA